MITKRVQYFAEYWSLILDDWQTIGYAASDMQEAKRRIEEYAAKYPSCDKFRIVTIRTTEKIQTVHVKHSTDKKVKVTLVKG